MPVEHTGWSAARDARNARSAFAEPVSAMVASTRAHQQAPSAAKPRLQAPSGALLLPTSATRARAAAFGKPTTQRLEALVQRYRAATSSPAEKDAALSDLRALAATTKLMPSARFFGGGLHKQSDCFDAQLSGGSPLAHLYRAVYGTNGAVKIGRVVSEATIPRLVGGTLVDLLDEHARAFAAQLDLGLYNALVCGAAVRALRAQRMAGMPHLETLLDIALPFRAPEGTFADRRLPDSGRGVGVRRGQPGALARSTAPGVQRERPLTEGGIPYTAVRMSKEGLA